MAKRKQKQPLRSKETPAPNPVKKKTAKAGKRYWAKRFYIPGFGFVDHGDEASQEALIAWAKKSKLSADNYLTKEVDKGREQPLTDKEKLKEYEALKKE